MYFFSRRILSYFAKPNFIIYDEWFDDDLEKNKYDIKNKKIKNISHLHEFYYQQSNYKIGASENNLELEIKFIEKELGTNYFIDNTSKKFNLLTIKNFRFFEKLIKNKFKFNFAKKLIYSLSIFGFILIFGFLLFFNTESKKNESNLINKSLSQEKKF